MLFISNYIPKKLWARLTEIDERGRRMYVSPSELDNQQIKLDFI